MDTSCRYSITQLLSYSWVKDWAKQQYQRAKRQVHKVVSRAKTIVRKTVSKVAQTTKKTAKAILSSAKGVAKTVARQAAKAIQRGGTAVRNAASQVAIATRYAVNAAVNIGKPAVNTAMDVGSKIGGAAGSAMLGGLGLGGVALGAERRGGSGGQIDSWVTQGAEAFNSFVYGKLLGGPRYGSSDIEAAVDLLGSRQAGREANSLADVLVKRNINIVYVPDSELPLVDGKRARSMWDPSLLYPWTPGTIQLGESNRWRHEEMPHLLLKHIAHEGYHAMNETATEGECNAFAARIVDQFD